MLEKLKKFVLNRIRESNDVYEAVRPMYLFSIPLGLVCYTTKNEKGKKTYEITYMSFLRNIFQVFIFAWLFAYNALTQPYSFYGTDMMVKVQRFQDAVVNFLAISELVFGIIFAKKLVEAFGNIDDVDRWLKRLGLLVTYKTAHITIIAGVIVSLATTLVVLAAVTDWVFYTGLTDIFESMSRALINFCPYVMYFLFQFQYVSYTAILTRKYKLLNTYLKSLLREDRSKKDAWTITFAKHKPKVTEELKTVSDPVFVVDSVAALSIKLNNTAILINQAFGVQLLFSITMAFIGLVTALFSIAVNFSRKATAESKSWNLMFTAWAFVSALHLLGIVHFTCKLCEKANKCPKILHRIRNISTDTKLNNTIEMYSLQMYHNRLQFHVCGLFPLDYTLLYTIVAGITTYLVILIQFNNAAYLKKGYEITKFNATNTSAETNTT